MIRFVLWSLAAVLVAWPLGAQVPGASPPVDRDSTLVDRVVAVVGDSVILLSQVDEEVALAMSQGFETGAQEILDALVDLQLVLQAAAKDSTLVPQDAEIEGRVTAQVEAVQQNFGSQEAFEEALAARGMTPARYRELMRERLRTTMVQAMYMQRQIQSAPVVAVSEEEMRAVFEERQEELGERPELLTVQQVLLPTGASDDSWTDAERLADSLRTELVAGADFEALAREFSQDPGSAVQGGALGWIQRGATVPEFDRTTFSMRDGALSQPVRTEYGFHVILVERSRPGEKRVRHILITPEVGEEDLASSRRSAEDIARRIREGEDALELAEEFGDKELPSDFPYAPAEPGSIPPVFVQNLAGTREGDVVGPFQAELRGRMYYAVLKVADQREAGRFTFEDLRNTIQEALLDEKRRERVHESLRERTHVEYRD